MGVTVGIRELFSSWAQSGSAGDTFGAVNALFSGLAFAGVIYSLNLQRRDMNSQIEEILETQRISEGQLKEMRAARELQAQPLVMPSITSCRIERPRFFYTPPEQRHSAQSRYFVDVDLSNPTPHPALNINVSSSLQSSPTGGAWGAVSAFVAALPPEIKNSDQNAFFMFVRDETGELFDSLLQGDPRKVPVLNVSVIFKSTSGAHFSLSQAFQLFAPPDKASVMARWHSGIVGFAARYKRELNSLQQFLARNQEKDRQEAFDAVKSQFEAEMGEEEYIDLVVKPMPNMFEMKVLSKESYDQYLSKLGYPKMVSEIYDCPSEIDSR